LQILSNQNEIHAQKGSPDRQTSTQNKFKAMPSIEAKRNLIPKEWIKLNGLEGVIGVSHERDIIDMNGENAHHEGEQRWMDAISRYLGAERSRACEEQPRIS
jgi:hypothetical protein